MWKPQQLVDRNCFSLWHIMSNRKHAMWNKKHAMWNTKHVICKHIPYFEKWPNVSWMEPWLRNLTEPNVSWMEPWLRNFSEPNVSWMEPSLRNLSKPNVSWMEPSLRNLSEPNVSWMEPSLRNLSEPNISWMEPGLRNLSEPNVSWMEPSLRNLSKPNISWMEPGLRNLSEPNVSWMEPSLRNLSEPNVSWMEPWLRNLSEPNVSWMEPSLRNLSEPNVSWMEPSLRNLSEPNVSWMEPWLRNLSEPNVSWMEPWLRNRFHSFGTSRNLVQGFGRLPQTTPKLYWKNPKPFRLLGNKTNPNLEPKRNNKSKKKRKIWCPGSPGFCVFVYFPCFFFGLCLWTEHSELPFGSLNVAELPLTNQDYKGPLTKQIKYFKQMKKARPNKKQTWTSNDRQTTKKLLWALTGSKRSGFNLLEPSQGARLTWTKKVGRKPVRTCPLNESPSVC